MLRRLLIEDYGLIPRAEIAFSAGATICTGETGSGKTMVLGAVAFVLGERASADIVRRGRPRAMVTLEFEAGTELRERFAADGFALDPDEDATISREMSASGKSTLRLNGRPATAGYVREFAWAIVDIVGQHEAQRLLAPSFHLQLLDRFAGDPALKMRERVGALHARCGALEDELRSLDLDERRAQEQYAYAKFALEEIDAAAPEDGEDERLTQRRRVLENAEKIALGLRAAHAALAEEEGAADALGAASSALAHLSEYAAAFAEMTAAVSALQSEAGELAARIAGELDAMEFDAGELEAINARGEILDTLKRKYGGSLEAVLHSREEFNSTVERLADGGERRAGLERELQTARAQLADDAARLSGLRRSAAQRLSKAVESELKDLALASARFDVHFDVLPQIGAAGAEHVEFLFAANKGESARPLGKVASGGELSRVLLALVVVLAGARGGTALLFDEIDAGIGGATATAVGLRLGRLAQRSQVVCVTHLAQMASWADAHFVLSKVESRNETTIEVRPLTDDAERTAELARMLSGEAHEAALEHARTLLAQTHERRAAS